MVVAREAVGPVFLDLRGDPTNVAAPHGLPGPSLLLDGHQRIHIFALVVEPQPHRIALETTIGAVLGFVQPHVGTTGFPMRRVSRDGSLHNDDGLRHVVLINAVHDLQNLQVVGDALACTDPARTVALGQHTRRPGGADGTFSPVMLRTVGHGSSLSAPLLDAAGKTLALGPTVDIHQITLLQEVRGPNLLANLPFLPILWPHAEVLDLSQRWTLVARQALDLQGAFAFLLALVRSIAFIAHLY
mmetsp:Transcript_68736/g.108305  ORF Transcript_68736/g.108305 Transcript_68736/m.108305 type:complete len:244 (+) Transcript_68736:93-824(+)